MIDWTTFLKWFFGIIIGFTIWLAIGLGITGVIGDIYGHYLIIYGIYVLITISGIFALVLAYD